jgi:hypothetical protein
MFKKISEIVAGAASFLKTGKVPPKTPIEFRQDFSKINFFSSKKFFIVFSSVVLLMLFYLISVGILFLTVSYPTIIDPYVTIFVESIKIFAIIISVYLGLQASLDFKYSSDSTVKHETFKNIEQIDETIITEETVKYAEIYKDDPSYAPIEWVMEQDQ